MRAKFAAASRVWDTNSLRKKFYWLQALWIGLTWIHLGKHVKYMINLQDVLRSLSSTKHVSTCLNLNIWLAACTICWRKTKALLLLAKVIYLVLSPWTLCKIPKCQLLLSVFTGFLMQWQFKRAWWHNSKKILIKAISFDFDF